METYAKRFKSFYNSAAWQQLRKRVLIDSDYLCVECRSQGKIREAKQVHHKITLEQDYSKRLDYDNLEPLCDECHNEAHERRSELQRFMETWCDTPLPK